MDIHQIIMDEPLIALRGATKDREWYQKEWERALKRAAVSHSLRAVGVAAGISHARVAQIVGRRA